jgi:MYXO-CTERM domain-containing protein
VLPGTAIMLTTTPMPEPSMALMWAAGVLTLVALARRRMKVQPRRLPESIGFTAPA